MANTSNVEADASWKYFGLPSLGSKGEFELLLEWPLYASMLYSVFAYDASMVIYLEQGADLHIECGYCYRCSMVSVSVIKVSTVCLFAWTCVRVCGWSVERAGFVSPDANHNACLSAAELYVQCHSVIANSHHWRVQQRCDHLQHSFVSLLPSIFVLYAKATEYEPSHWVCKPALFGACPKTG